MTSSQTLLIICKRSAQHWAVRLFDRIKGSAHHNMKELRAGSTGTSEIRILCVFDPERQAVLLVGGDKSGQRKQWYAENIALADARYTRWLDDEHNEGR